MINVSGNLYQVQVDAPSVGSPIIHKTLEILDIEAVLTFLDRPKDLAIGARLVFEPMACIAKDSGSTAICPKSTKTVFPCSSMQKLLVSMSGCMNISRSLLKSTGFTPCWARIESHLLAWRRLHIRGWWILEKDALCLCTARGPGRLRNLEAPHTPERICGGCNRPPKGQSHGWEEVGPLRAT